MTAKKTGNKPDTGSPKRDEPTWELETERKAKADRYYNEHLEEQRQWYSKNASKNKAWSRFLGAAILTAGALTTAVQIADPSATVQIITAVLGLIIVLSEGLERLCGFGDCWLGYRKASEAMKREYRLYINNTGGYDTEPDEQQAFRSFVEQVESIIAEENMHFWKRREAKEVAAKPPQAAEEAAKTADL